MAPVVRADAKVRVTVLFEMVYEETVGAPPPVTVKSLPVFVPDTATFSDIVKVMVLPAYDAEEMVGKCGVRSERGALWV